MFPTPFNECAREQRGFSTQEGSENIRSFQKLFSKISGKGLTEQKTNVLLEIFPFSGTGSLKFTLCD